MSYTLPVCSLLSSCSHPDNTQIIHEHRERGAGWEVEDTQTVALIHAADATQDPHFVTFVYEYIL